jgi:hypothetical protein
VLAWPCAGENRGKKKRGAGHGGVHFIGADGGEGKKVGGSDRGCHAAGNGRRRWGGGASPTAAAGGQHRPWIGGQRAMRGAAMPRGRRKIVEPGKADAWALATLPRGLVVHSVQMKFNEFK